MSGSSRAPRPQGEAPPPCPGRRLCNSSRATATERRSAHLAYGVERVTTRIRLLGGGAEGLGEDVSPFVDEHDSLHVCPPTLPLAGHWDLGALCDHMAQLDQWPVPPRWDSTRRWRR